MAWVPLIVANRRSRYGRNRASGAIIAAVIFFLLLGVFFWFFFDPFSGFTIFPLWIFISGFGGFILIIAIIAIIASSMSSTTQKYKEEHMKHMKSIENQERALLNNPYRVQDSIQKQPEESNYKVKRDIPIISDINYCRYCGEKVDRDAKFCHQCGIKF